MGIQSSVLSVHCFLQFSNLSRLEGHSLELANLNILDNVRTRVAIHTQMFKNLSTKQELAAKIFNCHLCAKCEGQ